MYYVVIMLELKHKILIVLRDMEFLELTRLMQSGKTMGGGGRHPPRSGQISCKIGGKLLLSPIGTKAHKGLQIQTDRCANTIRSVLRKSAVEIFNSEFSTLERMGQPIVKYSSITASWIGANGTEEYE